MNMLWYALAIPLIYITSDIYIYISPKLHRNTQIQDTCIVFRSWHISSNTAFVFSCLAILALGVFYEWLRRAQGQFDVKVAATLSAQGKGKATAVSAGVSASGRSTPEVDSEEAGLLTGVRNLKEHAT